MKSPAKPEKAIAARKAFILRLKPGSYQKYKEYHDNIWPEMVQAIEKSGIATLTIFNDDLQLFLHSEIYDEKAWDKLWNSPAHKKWAKCMEPLMQFRPDGKVDAKPLQEIFHLRTRAADLANKPKGQTSTARRASPRKE